MRENISEFVISDDKSRIDLQSVHHFLSTESYWARGIPFETFKRSVENCLCFGVYLREKQIGFARVITDQATIAYLGDVFILPEFRSKGLSKRLVETIMTHPRLQGLRRWILATADAHGLYAQYGFKPLAKPERWMEKADPDVYARQKNEEHKIQ